MYSDMIENAAAVLSAKSGWNQEQSVDYIEDLVFNSNENIPGLLASITNGLFEFYPAVRIRRGKAKGEKRDLWKAPRWVQEAKILGITKKDLDELHEARRDYFCRRHTPEERIIAKNRMDRFFRQMDAEQNRHYTRLDEYGFWGAGMKELFYGILSRQSKSEKNWKRNVQQELASENLHALRVH
ncbi:MAG: hypothetical protein IJI41_05585 [Anaerolineaceae bacterium]|nr:hypothetical protein [Anaerolineaceae bacterium]